LRDLGEWEGYGRIANVNKSYDEKLCSNTFAHILQYKCGKHAVNIQKIVEAIRLTERPVLR